MLKTAPAIHSTSIYCPSPYFIRNLTHSNRVHICSLAVNFSFSSSLAHSHASMPCGNAAIRPAQSIYFALLCTVRSTAVTVAVVCRGLPLTFLQSLVLLVGLI